MRGCILFRLFVDYEARRPVFSKLGGRQAGRQI